MNSDPAQTQINIRDIFPNLSDGQLKEAEENLRRYVAVALRIHQGTELTATVLDAPPASPKMEERSNPSLKS